MNRDIYFLALPNLLVLDMVGPSETFRIASEHFNLIYIGVEPRVKTSTGLWLADLAPLPEVLPKDCWVVIPGVYDSSRDFDNPQAEEAAHWISGFKRQVDEGDINILCICSGAILAARAGLLNHRRCTTHHSILERLRQEAPSAELIENLLFVEDRGVYTCAGIMSGIDLALEFVRKFMGVKDCLRVAKEMVVYLPRNGHDTQSSPWLRYRYHHHPIIHRAQDLISTSPQKHWSLETISSEVHISSRQLSRLFKQYLNMSVKEYHDHVKLILVSQYIDQGERLESATYLSGFSSVRQFRRVQSRSK